MKLEDLRKRLQEPKRPKARPKTRKRRNPAAASAAVSPMHANFQFRCSDWYTKPLAVKCGKTFTRDPDLDVVPSTCAKCESYL